MMREKNIEKNKLVQFKVAINLYINFCGRNEKITSQLVKKYIMKRPNQEANHVNEQEFTISKKQNWSSP